MAHPNEPSVKTLKEIRLALFTSESTDDNIKKIKAIDGQIARREAENKAEVDKK